MFKVRYSYLPQQFADPSEILDELRRFISGAPVVTDATVAANTTASDATSPQPTNW